MEIIALPNTRKIVYTVATCSLHNTKYLVSLHWQENTILSNLNEVDSYAKTNFEENFFHTFAEAENGFNPVKFWLSAQIASQFPALSRHTSFKCFKRKGLQPCRQYSYEKAFPVVIINCGSLNSSEFWTAFRLV